MAQAKTYVFGTPHARFIDSRGNVHSFNGAGKLTTEDAGLQAELEAAIKAGQAFSIGENSVPPPEPVVEQKDPEVALVALKAANVATSATLAKK